MDILSETTNAAWECECEDDCFHLRGTAYCRACMSDESECPDAQLDVAIDKAMEFLSNQKDLTVDQREFIMNILETVNECGRRARVSEQAAERGENILELYRDTDEDADDRAYVVRAIKDLMHAGRESGAFPDQLMDAAREQFRMEDPTL